MFRYSFGIILSILVAAAGPAQAGTTATLVRADTLTARDASLLAASGDLNYGNAADLIVRDTKGSAKGNSVLDFTLPNLSGRTVLQASLRLQQNLATKSKPSVIRIYPLSESWTESQVTWNERSAGTPWATPGGSFASYWSDQVLVSTATVGTTLSWQVGPILAAYATGAYGIRS